MNLKWITAGVLAAGTFAGVALIPSTFLTVAAYTIGGIIVMFLGAGFAEAKLGARGNARPQPHAYTRDNGKEPADTQPPTRLVASRPINEDDPALTRPLRRADLDGENEDVSGPVEWWR